MFFCFFVVVVFQESTVYKVETGNKSLLLTMYDFFIFFYITDVSLREALETIIILIIKKYYFLTGERSGSTTLSQVKLEGHNLIKDRKHFHTSS